MESNLILWIRPLHFVWQIAGFAYFDNGLLRFFEFLYFLLVLASSFCCVYITETWLVQFYPGLFEIHLVIMAITTQWHQLYPLFNIITYRLMSNKVRQLFEFVNHLCVQKLELQSIDYAKILFIGIAIFGQFFAVMFATVTYLKPSSGLDASPQIFYCAIKNAFSIAFPTLQFIWWIFLFCFLFVKLENKLLVKVADMHNQTGNDTSVSSKCQWVRHSLSPMKDIFEMKRCIICYYGLFVLFYPVGWLTALLHTCSLLSGEVGTVHVVMLFMFVITSLFQCYLLFWSCQMAIIMMKKSLYSIRKLVVINQPSFADKQLANFLLGLLHDDLNFKICNLVDLTNKRFLSVGKVLCILKLVE